MASVGEVYDRTGKQLKEGDVVRRFPPSFAVQDQPMTVLGWEVDTSLPEPETDGLGEIFGELTVEEADGTWEPYPIYGPQPAVCWDLVRIEKPKEEGDP